jgi:hypothetical protein
MNIVLFVILFPVGLVLVTAESFPAGRLGCRPDRPVPSEKRP